MRAAGGFAACGGPRRSGPPSAAKPARAGRPAGPPPGPQARPPAPPSAWPHEPGSALGTGVRAPRPGPRLPRGPAAAALGYKEPAQPGPGRGPDAPKVIRGGGQGGGGAGLCEPFGGGPGQVFVPRRRRLLCVLAPPPRHRGRGSRPGREAEPGRTAAGAAGAGPGSAHPGQSLLGPRLPVEGGGALERGGLLPAPPLGRLHPAPRRAQSGTRGVSGVSGCSASIAVHPLPGPGSLDFPRWPFLGRFWLLSPPRPCPSTFPVLPWFRFCVRASNRTWGLRLPQCWGRSRGCAQGHTVSWNLAFPTAGLGL
ncbi:E3 ubiquitin-protein ligase RNF4 isoform X2 [Vulpes vulpes]|uniref:E3 ubiquitin-protein ligase RNF4 isoform X2 n=1 Tax=Vulpes vulpes TaxID=9627 RepID=A0ABM4YU35_VULVU